MTSTPEDENVAKPFAQVVREIGAERGVGKSLHDDLTAEYHDLLAAVVEHQKPGTLTLTIKVDVDTKMSTKFLKITDVVTVKAPKAPRQATGMFYNPTTGQQQREHPNMNPLLDADGLVVVGRDTGDDVVVVTTKQGDDVVRIPKEGTNA